MTSVKFNKKVTVVKDNSISTFRTKKDFWSWASTQDSITITAGHNKTQIINKLNTLGFNIDVDDSFGFDFDFKVIAKK
jgi:hypothetical protein|tara:strand:+ start:1186 stop:1419 length:234 start_codon:yes stop_codon:yes gene_type:complete